MQAMTTEEKAKFEKMESSVDQIQADVSTIKSALLGNVMSGDKGLVGQIDTLKAEHSIMKAEIKALSEDRVKNTVYVKIITWLLAVIGVGVVSLIVNYFK
jgi:archaellum component FlaD/FlaE